MDLWQRVYPNASNRPTMAPDEYPVYIRDHVGVYQGKLKIEARQNGRIYLTNMRVIYFDNEQPTQLMALDLTNVTGFETVDGFLKRSPKVRLFVDPGAPTTAPGTSRGSPAPATTIRWVCGICSFNNEARPLYQGDTTLACSNCGIPALKADLQRASEEPDQKPAPAPARAQCPTCTFVNHPLMHTCEMCGTSLRKGLAAATTARAKIELEGGATTPVYLTPDRPYIKLLFRKGGEAKFCQHLQEVLDDLKWNRLRAAGKISQDGTKLEQTPMAPAPSGGILGLERLGEQRRKHTELVLTLLLNDLEQLMFKFEDLLKVTGATGAALTPVLPPRAMGAASQVYVPELARQLSEFCHNFELVRTSSMVTTQELYTKYNRFLVSTQGFGAELVLATDFNLAVAMFELLGLPLKLRNYQLGLVVAPARTLKLYSAYIAEFMRRQFVSWTHAKWRARLELGGAPGPEWAYFRGNTIAEICEHFNWNYNIAVEEIGQCIDSGTVVIDENILGTFYFLNIFEPANYAIDEAAVRREVEQELAREQLEISQGLRSQFDASHTLVAFTDYDFGAADTISTLGDTLASSQRPGSEEPVLAPSKENTPSLYLQDLSGLNFS